MKRWFCVFVIVLLLFKTLGISNVFYAKNEEWLELKKEYYECLEKKEVDKNRYISQNEVESNRELQKILKMKNNENNKFDNSYSGAYLDNEGELVVCINDENEEILDEIREVTGNEEIKFKKVEYSIEQLYEIQKIIIYKINRLKDNCLEKYSFLERLQGVGIDEENNMINIYIVDLRQEDKKEFKSLFEYENINFISEDAVIEKNDTWKPGRAIYVKTASDSASRVSTGYRAYCNNGAYTYYGFVTCGHGIENSIDGYVYTNFGTTNKLGKIYKVYNNSKCDASFIYLSYTAYTKVYYVNGTTKYTVGNNTNYKNHELETYTYMTSLAKNSSVCFEGSTTYFGGGKITDTNCWKYYEGDGFVFNLFETNIKTNGGDSGGILYYIDENNDCIPCGTLVGSSCFTKASTAVSYLGIQPY